MEIDFENISPTQHYQFLTSVVVPRPIAWITTLNADGQVNAAPFSFFNVFGSKPPLVALGIGNRSTGEPKDTVLNIRRGGEFVINLVTETLAAQMVQTAYEYPHDQNELAAVGLTTTPSQKVASPRIAESPVHLECRELSTQEIGGNRLILGQVLHAAIADQYYDPENHIVLTEKIAPIGRMNGPDGYTRTTNRLTLPRPKNP